jgi:hypothetical protein
MWLWGLFLILSCGALALRRSSGRFAAVALVFAICTAALAVAIFSACSVYAPFSMGLPASISATGLTTLMCLSQDAFGTAILWTIIIVSCSAALGSVLWARVRSKSPTRRAFAYIGAALLLLVATASVLLGIFAFMLCSTTWVF